MLSPSWDDEAIATGQLGCGAHLDEVESLSRIIESGRFVQEDKVFEKCSLQRQNADSEVHGAVERDVWRSGILESVTVGFRRMPS